MKCWSCSEPMETHRADEVDHQVCGLCHGLAVPLLRSLALWRALDGLEQEEPQGLGAPVATRCGACDGPAETFGYQYSDVSVQRCTACSLLWVSGDQQLAVRNLWRKANSKEEKQMRQRTEELAEELRNRPVQVASVGNSGSSRAYQHAANSRMAELEASRLMSKLARLTPEDEE